MTNSVKKTNNHQFSFATTKRFAPLFSTQFFTAFNDNFYKTALFVLIFFHGLGSNDYLSASQMLNFGALLFILPYFLFSALSGQLNTKYDKANIAKYCKLAEVFIMMIAACAFYIDSIILLLICLFLMGVHSSIFGPVKYAILPDYLAEKDLLSGNSLIEMGTFIAILIGQISGTIIAGHNNYLWLSICILILALLGLLSSLLMPKVGIKNAKTKINLNIFGSTWMLLKNIIQHKKLFIGILGISWFWFLGAVYTTQLPSFTSINLNGDENVFNLILTLFSIGIGLGLIICAKISHAKLHLSLIIPGLLGMTICGLLLIILTEFVITPGDKIMTLLEFIRNISYWPIILCFLGIGFFGGFFSVPLYTWLQISSSDGFRAHAIAANNIVNGLFMVVAALTSVLLLWLFNSISLLYLIVTLGNIIALFGLLKAEKEIWEDGKLFLRKLIRKE